MKKITQILIILFLLILVGAGISGPIKTAHAASCFSPFQRIDLEEVYNGSVCRGNFQVYYFPVVTDGRQYTITLRTISGEQKLYASRYKNDVAKLSNVLNWRCYGPHCDSSTEANATTRFVTFQSPAGDTDYYSWFAVYGSTDSQYQIGLSNDGVFPFVSGGGPNLVYNPNPPQNNATINGLPVISWKATTPGSDYDFYNTFWTNAYHDDSSWPGLALPDKSAWNCEHCYREYRGTFYLDSVPNNLKMWFVSDDGIRIYINGQAVGSWGAKDANEVGCVNNYGCIIRDEVGDIPLTNLVKGKNIISAVVINGAQGAYFDFKLKR